MANIDLSVDPESNVDCQSTLKVMLIEVMMIRSNCLHNSLLKNLDQYDKLLIEYDMSPIPLNSKMFNSPI